MSDELIERLKKATGEDRELDCAIAEYVGTYSAPDRGDPDGTWPNYTGSVDAALTLVPEEWQGVYISTEWWGIRKGADPTQQRHAVTIRRSVYSYVTAEAEAATTALALCIAALLARQRIAEQVDS